MNLRFLLFLLIFWLGSQAQGQNEKYLLKYREDQFYVSFSIIFQKESINGFKQNGFSNNFQIGFLRDIPFNIEGNLGIALGLGYSFDKLVSNLNLNNDEQNNLYFSILDNEQNSQKISNIIFPLEFRWRTSTINKTEFWRLYGGFKYKINLNSQFNNFTGGNSRVSFIRKQNTAIYISLGYNTWNLLFEYDLNSIYNRDIILVEGLNPNVRTIKIGLIFYIL
jgi:hypothetical protein